MSFAFDIPVVVTAAGPQPTPPATLLAQLIASVTSTNPGYTANLPLSLIEDVSSTEVAGLVVCDTARIETINSISPFLANDFMLTQLGQIYIGEGSAPAVPTNASAEVQFTVTNTLTSSPAPGVTIPIGFTVSDGINQYFVQDGGVTNSGGIVTLFCLTNVPGTAGAAPATIVNVVTSVPVSAGITIACTNPLAGTGAQPAETAQNYRARVLQAGQAISQGMPSMLRTLLGQVPGVQQRLISVAQQPNGWTVFAGGGGDPYQIAGAIFEALFDISSLVGAPLNVTNITRASPGQVTTATNHNLVNGETIEITGVVGMTQINGLPLTVTVIDQKNFTVGISTLGFSGYTSGGTILPNPINETVNLFNYPDTYSIPFVNPPSQIVTMTVTWNTTVPNFVQQAAVSQAVQPATAASVNAVVVGQPLNLNVLIEAFLEAVSDILQPSQVSVLKFSVSINGIVTPPQVGTELVFGDPNSYFLAVSSGINVVQG